jgi:hypothetical protein
MSGRVLLPADAAAGPVGIHQRRELLRRRDEHARVRRQVRRRVAVDQHRRVLLGKHVLAFVAGRRGVVDIEEPRDGLLFQPLPRVPFRDARVLRQLRRRRPAAELRVQPQPVAQVDVHQLGGSDQGSQESLQQRVRLLPHRSSLPLTERAA